MSRLGLARPVSRKLRRRAEISASRARVSWLRRRRSRHWRMSPPTALAATGFLRGFTSAFGAMPGVYNALPTWDITCRVIATAARRADHETLEPTMQAHHMEEVR